jgi:uncharacterized Fe-S radical SAM superfamily protein PflX
VTNVICENGVRKDSQTPHSPTKRFFSGCMFACCFCQSSKICCDSQTSCWVLVSRTAMIWFNISGFSPLLTI